MGGTWGHETQKMYVAEAGAMNSTTCVDYVVLQFSFFSWITVTTYNGTVFDPGVGFQFGV